MVDRLIFRIFLLCFALPATAQSVLTDPTRPPVGMSGDTTAIIGAGGPVLQSVIIPKKGKPMAVIGGQQVLLGGMYGDNRLISLTEKEAVLEGPTGVERLALTPGVGKVNISVKTPVAKSEQSRGKP